MRLLVTGGLGFIGSNFVNYWLKEHSGDHIVNLDKVTYAASFSNISPDIEQSSYEFVRGDISDRELVDDLVEGVDAVVNFAAESHVDNSIKDPEEFLSSNYMGVYSILEAARKHDVRFHHVSTDEVFGSLPLDSSEMFNISSPYNPRNPYSATKAGSDHLIRAYVNTYGIEATISICSNNFGPNQNPEKLIPKTILNALDDRKIPVYGDGRNIRDWIYVLDHCSAIDRILESGTSGESYIVGAGNEMSNLDLIRKVLDIMGKEESLIEFVPDRPGHDRRYAFDTGSVMKGLDWKPSYTFNESLEETVKFYIENIENFVNP